MLTKEKKIILKAKRIEDLPKNLKEEIEILMIDFIENNLDADEEKFFKELLDETNYLRRELESFKNLQDKLIETYKPVFEDSRFESNIRTLIQDNLKEENSSRNYNNFSLKNIIPFFIKNIEFNKTDFMRVAATLVLGVFIGSSFFSTSIDDTSKTNETFSIYKSLDLEDEMKGFEDIEIASIISEILLEFEDLEIGSKATAQFGRSGNSVTTLVKKGNNDSCKIITLSFRGLEEYKELDFEYCLDNNRYILEDVK